MIITKEDFFEMGFTAEDKDAALLESCIKRAEFVLNGLTGNRASVIALGEGAAADLVKQAAAFQADSLMREELWLAAKNAAANSGSSSSKTEERVSIGDFSYSEGTSESRSPNTSDYSVQPISRDKTVLRLLRAAGCLYSGTEVLE